MKYSVPTLKRLQPGLGTWIEISVRDSSRLDRGQDRLNPDFVHEAISIAFSEVRRLERIFSAFDSQSELSALNRSQSGSPCVLSNELQTVLDSGLKLERQSRRSFRLMPRCDHELQCFQLLAGSFTRLGACLLDLGGIAKGHIVDQAFEFLRTKLPEAEISVSAGGDLRTSFTDSVELAIPTAGGDVPRPHALEGQDHAVATSSRLTGPSSLARYPSDQLKVGTPSSVTVQAKSCMVADAMTKVALFGQVRDISFDDWGILRVIEFDPSGTPSRVIS
ncbi:MAG: FAD:protein FMN transferase [Methylotenera sp.]|nr:FAD:protein FMN transferase [Oligoflexia bacterium]